MKIHKLMKIILSSLILLGLSASGVLFWMLNKNQNNGRIVNAAGLVRGSAQRIVKLHLMDQPVEELIANTEKVMNALQNGDPSLSLAKVNDRTFLEKVQNMQDYWSTDLKPQLIHAASELDSQALYQKSEHFFTLSDEAVNAAEAFSARRIARIKGFTLIILVLNLLSIAVIWRIVNKRMLHPLSELEDEIFEIAHGNLSTEINYTSPDELGSLADSMRYMTESLKGYISEIQFELSEISNGNLDIQSDAAFNGDFLAIREALDTIIYRLSRTVITIHKSADHVAAASSQMANGTEFLAHSSMEENNSMHSLSATVAQVSEHVGNTASSAAHAGKMVDKVHEQIEFCGEKMQEMVQAMDKISASSAGIEKITKAIEDISFQTNILALNAAVEAARAGAAGKGFAVVADEVRALANRSSESVKSTSVLVQESQNTVKNGTEIVAQTASLLREVITMAQEVTGTVASITSATAEQTTSIEDIMNGIDEITCVVANNSATTQENSAASIELANEAENLKNLVGHFKLSEDIVNAADNM